MKAITLLYHDVVPVNDYSYSGFLSAAADLYKYNKTDFDQHLGSLSGVIANPPSLIWDMNLRKSGNKPIMLTFDDGGVCAHTIIADMLDEMGWKAHFFITTDYIGDRGFVNKQQVADLRNRGHVIGSHSASHPTVMSSLDYKSLKEEWTKSRKKLEEIVGEPVKSASIPGGFYSRDVAGAASEAGIEALFTSEPVQKIRMVDNCMVIGRYTIFRRLTARKAAMIASGRMNTCFGQWFYWNLKKAAKKGGGRFYSKFRDAIAESKSNARIK